PAHHVTSDVLQKHERGLPLTADLDEMRGLQRALAEQHAVVGENANRVAVDPGPSRDERRAVARFELVKAATVDDARQELADLVGLARVPRYEPVELLGVVCGRLRRRYPLERKLLGEGQVRKDRAHDLERVGIIVGEMVRHTRDTRVHVAASELLRSDDL